MDYYQYSISCEASQTEVIIALLSDLPFDTFEEVEAGFNAFMPALEHETQNVEAALNELSGRFGFSFTKAFVEGQNWNEIWESNFHPVIIDDFCAVRADFHPLIPTVEHELVINPKMAFGTGHHETTYSVIQLMRGIEFQGKSVLDFGCGTGVLAILAARLGAAHVEAVDIEIESFKNTVENSQNNGAGHVIALHGGLEVVPGNDFDVILANINRNVILASLSPLKRLLKPGGLLVVSGFILADEDIMTDSLAEHGFKIQEVKRRNNWLAFLTSSA